jgi:hypothetical protein
MNYIKTTSLLFFSFLLFISCQPKELPTITEAGEDFITVKLSHQSTEAEMKAIQNELSKRNVVFDFSGSVFFEDGRLRQLELTVSIPNVGSGRTKADLMTLQTRYMGFIFNKNQNPVFKIGEV